MKRKPPRLRYEIRFEVGAWMLFGPDDLSGDSICDRAYKADLVWLAASLLTNAWEDIGVRSELTIKRRDGSIQDKRTYGADPRRTRG